MHGGGSRDALSSLLTTWHHLPDVAGLQRLVQGAAFALAFLVALVPSPRAQVQLAAFDAVVIIALELGHTFWSFLYISWWAPSSSPPGWHGIVTLGRTPTTNPRRESPRMLRFAVGLDRGRTLPIWLGLRTRIAGLSGVEDPAWAFDNPPLGFHSPTRR